MTNVGKRWKVWWWYLIFKFVVKLSGYALSWLVIFWSQSSFNFMLSGVTCKVMAYRCMKCIENIQQNCAFWHPHIPPFFSFFFFPHHPYFPQGSLPLLPPWAHLPKSFPSIFASFCLLPPYCRLCCADTSAKAKPHQLSREGKNAQMVNQWGVS